MTVSFLVATIVVLDPWRDEEAIFGDARLAPFASTAASITFKFGDSAGKRFDSSGKGYGTLGARGRSPRGADSGADPPDFPSLSSDDNRH